MSSMFVARKRGGRSQFARLLRNGAARRRSKVEALGALARVDRPEGTLLLLWPGTWSIALAAGPGAIPDLKLMGLFAVGAFAMRGAGCTVNDMWDKDFDARVARTRTRPLAAGDLTLPEATVFLGGQLAAGLAVLTQLEDRAIVLGAASLPFVAFYPLAKRYTPLPQVVLGLTFNWGALLGYTAATGTWPDVAICAPLYGGCVAWTFMYDTLYAHQDKEDDAKLGLHSSALALGASTKPVLAAASAAAVAGIGLAGHNAGFAVGASHAAPFYTSLAIFGGHLAWQIHTADLDDTPNLAARFRSNAHVAPLLLLGMATSTYLAPVADTLSGSL